MSTLKVLKTLSVVLLLDLSASAATLVQSKACQDWSTYSFVYQCSFSTRTTQGNALIYVALDSDYTSSIRVSDDHSPSNVYATDLSLVVGGLQRMQYFSVAGAAPVTTVTLTSTKNNHWSVTIMEVSGLLSDGALKDKSVTYDNGYNTGGAFTSTPVAATLPTEFLVGYVENIYPNVYNYSDTPPWILVSQQPIGGPRVAYANVTSTGQYAYTGNIAGGSGEYDLTVAIVGYKACCPPLSQEQRARQNGRD